MQSPPIELRMELAVAPGTGFDRGDVAGLAVVFMLGGTLSWLTLYHPTELPPWAPWDFSWVEFLTASLGLWWYARGVIRTAPHACPSPWRQASFLLGVLAIYAVVQSRFDYMAQHEFFLNRVQHIFMHHLGPFLIALAWPGDTLYAGMPAPFRRIPGQRLVRRILGVVQQPLLAAILFVGLIYLFLLPPVQFRAMIDPRVYAIMNWSMIGDGLLFWFLVLDPRPKPQAGVSYATRMILPFGVMFPQIALGAYVAFSPGGLYPYYDLCGRLFPSISAATDQHIGGIVAWIPAGMMSVIGLMTVLNAMRVYEDSLPTEEPDHAEESPTRIVVYASSWTGRR
jgi:putative membrane protein